MAPERWHIPTNEDEIVDVFIEEAGELLETIDNQMKTWLDHPGDKKTLTEIRRCFHTLKGSGRMVKALDLSEMAWRVEKILNQAIAGTVPVSEPVVKLVAAVRAQIPWMVDAFKNQRSIAGNGDIERLMKLADALAAGRKPAQTPAPLASTSTSTATEGKPQVKLYELNLKLERFMQRADEALHRSEMALQQVRRTSTSNEAPLGVVGQQDCCAEADLIGERLNLLSEEVSELRIESQKSRSEMYRLVEQQVRARMAPIEHLRNDIERDIEESRRVVTTLRRFGWLALALSAMIGGVIAIGLHMSNLSLVSLG